MQENARIVGATARKATGHSQKEIFGSKTYQRNRGRDEHERGECEDEYFTGIRQTQGNDE